MLSVVSGFILDSFDEAMEPYCKTEEYINERHEINEKISAFRESLPDKQKEQLVELLNQINDADARMSEHAFLCGFEQGIRYKNEKNVE